MSRFFGGNSDTESSSDSGSESENENLIQSSGAKKGPVNPTAFLFSDDEEDTKRVVRSAKDKRYEQLHNIMKNIRNSKKIKDFNKMETSFQELQKAYDKAKTVIIKEEGGITPRFYVRILVEMEDLINETWEDREGRKSMSKNNSKSLSALRQKFRKYIRDFDDDMAKFRENPDGPDEDEKEDEMSGSEDSDDEGDKRKSREGSSVPSEKSSLKKAPKQALNDDDDSDGSYWDSSSDDVTSSSDSEPGMSLRDKFLKKDSDADKKDKKGKKIKKTPRRIKTIDEDDEDEDDDPSWIKVDRGTVEKPRMFEKDAEINHDLVVKKLLEIIAARGKKRTNRKEQIELLSELFSVSNENNLGIGMATKVQFAIIASIFDYNPKISEAMKSEYWEKCLPEVHSLLDSLIEHAEEISTGEHVTDEQEALTEKPYKVRGCYLSVVERLCEEFIKVLKSCDAHSNEYVNRLKDEPSVISCLEKAQNLIDKTGSSSEMCRIYLKRIEHLYFKFDPRVIQQKNGEIDAKEETSLQVMDRLCKYIYSKDATDRLRTHAILCHIYHHSIHDNWFEARDLMLMSHLQDTISHADPMTQILYNRTMVQLGLCGFRHAEIKEAHNALLDIQMGGRSKELLAQGLLPQRHHERSSEQEKIEKQRQVPFHMHINLEMLECVYLVSAMLIEIPYMAAHEYDARRRMISKSYYQQLRSSERQALVGPPESMREHVVAASKAMRNGDWKKCKTLIINDKMNTKVWDLFYEADKVRKMLGRKIQEESLRTHLFTYSKVYDSISVVTLAEMFELEKSTVHAIVSKMIINEELMASLDEPSECMVMHRTEPTRLQSLSLQLSDKIAQLVENNERLLELRPGGWQSGGGQWRKDDMDNGLSISRDLNGNSGGKSGRGYQQNGRRGKDGGKDGGRSGGKNNYNNNRNNWKNKSNRE